MRRHRAPTVSDVVANPILSGAIALLLIALVVFLSYNANNGLPFVPTYQLTVNVPDAAKLIKNAEVRIGGARVGQVTEITAMAGTGSKPPYARLRLALNRDLEPLSAATTVEVRPISILGSKYVQLRPAHTRPFVSDGGSLPLANTRPTVDIDQAFQIFDAGTSKGIRNTIDSLGDSVAGRGVALNDTIGATRRLLPGLQQLLRLLVAPHTGLARFVRAAASATGAIAPVAGTLGAFVDHGSQTLRALDAAGNSLGQTVEQLPPTEIVATRTLHDITPVVTDAAAITRALQPAVAHLPRATRQLDATVRLATPVLHRVHLFLDPLGGTLSSIDRLSRDPRTTGSLRLLGRNDLGTVGASIFVGLGAIFKTAATAQLNCNAIALWARNLSSAFSEGDSQGSWIRILGVTALDQMQAASKPAPDLHLNYYPNENASECEAGNLPYLPGQRIGNVPGNQSRSTPVTSPPPGVTELARRAGLLGPHGGGR